MREIFERYLEKHNDNSQEKLVAQFLLDAIDDGADRALLLSACHEIAASACEIADALACEHEVDSDAELENTGGDLIVSVTCRHCGEQGQRVLDASDMEWK